MILYVVVTLALALAVGLGFWLMCWSLEQQVRWMDEMVAYGVRVALREEPVGRDLMLETLAEAMYLSFRRDIDRLAALMADAPADSYEHEIARAQETVEMALAPGLRVVPR